MEKEDVILLHAIEDKKRQCEDQYMLTHTSFLDTRQCLLAENEYRSVRHLLYGGYEDAQRRIMVFFPDYMQVPEKGTLPEEDEVLEILRVHVPKGGKTLTHRDYLGSILSLGIDRSVTGDIIVRPDGADIIILKSMEEFLFSHYNQAGHTHLKTEIVPISALDPGEVHVSIKNDTVASLRADNIVGSAFNLARGKAQDAVRSGLVFVNGMQMQKADRELSEGDKVVLRGKGKAVIKAVGGKTRKDRIALTLEIFL